MAGHCRVPSHQSIPSLFFIITQYWLYQCKLRIVPVNFAVVCLDRSGIGPMLAASGRSRVGSGILRHIYRVVLFFVCYVELFWCYVFFVCTASPVSTATECRNKNVIETSLRYLSHSAVTIIVRYEIISDIFQVAFSNALYWTNIYVSNSYPNPTEVFFWWSNWQYLGFRLGNGVAPNRQQVPTSYYLTQRWSILLKLICVTRLKCVDIYCFITVLYVL